MNNELFSRSELLLGSNAMAKLSDSKVAVFGIGGVGSYVMEALVRSGISELIIIDGDRVDPSNINRQIIADTASVGMWKVDAAKERAERINPNIKVTAYNIFCDADTDYSFLDGCNYVVDAIDTVSAKLKIIEYCKKNNINVISAMGAGNKIDPTRFEVADVFSTSVCPLCRVMRHELRRLGIENLKVVYSKEEPISVPTPTDATKKTTGSLPFVPSVAGLIIAREVVFDIIKGE